MPRGEKRAPRGAVGRGGAPWRAAAALALAAAVGSPAAAQRADPIRGVRGAANGVLQVLTFTATPDSTAASLSIDSDSTSDPRFRQTQLGGAFTVSDEVPVYLEGFVGATRYDPEFVFSGGAEQRRVPTRWTGVTGTGGVGYDFALTDHWVFRPIANVALGYVASDLKVLDFVLESRTDADVDFLDDGQLFAYGYGASAMLDYELRRTDYEVDVELRYTALRFETFGGTSDAVEGSADSQTAAIWTRLRYPTGLTAFGAPVRAVWEGAHSSFFGPNRGALGFTDLSQIGLGVEFDTEDDGVLVTRTRIVGRFVFGEGVRGFGLGLGVSF
jgi:hypothetical protein